jgi:hypothetical protein
LFAKKEFIEASRKFVCIRIETYENKESEAMVRKLLNGKFANTAFCVFDPQGKRQLSSAGRSPSQGLQTRGGRGRGRGGPSAKPGSGTAAEDDSHDNVIRQMQRIAGQFKSTGESEETALQDFNTFRQALNVASADQRLLMFVNVDEKAITKVRSELQTVFADPEIVGKFHLDFANTKTDQKWGQAIDGSKNEPGLVIVHSGQFGIDGQVVSHLSATEDAESIKKALLAANEKFASAEKRKKYSSHVQQGRRQRLYFENEIPYGEDRDGDGKADGRGGRGSRR